MDRLFSSGEIVSLGILSVGNIAALPTRLCGLPCDGRPFLGGKLFGASCAAFEPTEPTKCDSGLVLYGLLVGWFTRHLGDDGGNEGVGIGRRLP